MPNIYPNTPIIEPTETINITIGYYAGNLILPLTMVLYVILYFRDDKNQLLYAVTMIFLFLTMPALITAIAGLFFMSLDKVSKWAKENKDIWDTIIYVH